jgi:hypothetical protein
VGSSVTYSIHFENRNERRGLIRERESSLVEEGVVVWTGGWREGERFFVKNADGGEMWEIIFFWFQKIIFVMNGNFF